MEYLLVNALGECIFKLLNLSIKGTRIRPKPLKMNEVREMKFTLENQRGKEVKDTYLYWHFVPI